MTYQDLDIDDIALASTKAKGKRPWYFENPEAERVLCVAMAIAGELAVCRTRLDTLERILQSKGLLDADDIENYEPDADAEAERGLLHRAYISRILRVVQQEMEGLHEGESSSLERVAQELSKE